MPHPEFPDQVLTYVDRKVQRFEVRYAIIDVLDRLHRYRLRTDGVTWFSTILIDRSPLGEGDWVWGPWAGTPADAIAALVTTLMLENPPAVRVDDDGLTSVDLGTFHHNPFRRA